MDKLIALTFLTVSGQFNLPPGLHSAICQVESHHNPFAVHHDDGGSDSLGICQVKLESARWMGFKGDAPELMNPKVNIYYSGKYLNYQLKRYHGNITKAVIAYNIGHAGKLTRTEYSDKVFKQWRNKNNERDSK